MEIKTKDETRNELKKEVDKCVKCRLCLYACPTFQVSERFETMGPFARIQTLKYLLHNKLEPDDSVIYSIYTCLHCGQCSVVCEKISAGLEVSDLIRLGKSLLSKDLLKEKKK